MLYYRLRWSLAWERQMMMSLYVGAIGAALALLLLWHEQPRLLPGNTELPQVVIRLLAGHWQAIRQGLPAFNWVWIVLLAFVPLLGVVVASRNALIKRSFSIQGVSLAFTVTAAICLFNAPASPWALLRQSDQLPVMAYLAVAMTLGFLVAFWHLAAARPDVDDEPDDEPDDERLSGTVHDAPSPTAAAGTAPFASPGLSLLDQLRSRVARVLGWSLVAAVGAAAILNLRTANGRSGAFADELAANILNRLGTRTWIVSDGGDLDLHLRILAQRQRRRLVLAPLTQTPSSDTLRRIRSGIARDQSLAAHETQLLNALERGIPAFVQEWLQLDSSAEEHLLSLNVPEVWSAAGRRPVTDGFGFTGVRDLNLLHDRDLLGPHRALWARLPGLLASAEAPLAGRAERIRFRLRRQAGLMANNLGVLLEDLGRSDDAIEAYVAAGRIDPDNLSALINLESARPTVPKGASSSELTRALKALGTAGGREPTLLEVVQTHGEIRRAETLAGHGMVWARLGESRLARTQLERALHISPSNTAGKINKQLADLDWRQGNVEDAIQKYHLAMEADNRDIRAMVGLAAAAVELGQPDEARMWLDRARAAGAPKRLLTVPTAMLLEATGHRDGAVAELRTCTDSGRGTMEEWALLAGLLLKQGALSEVDRRVLPAMERLAGGPGHVLIQLVKARALCARTPVNYAAARTSLKLCLRLRPDFVAIWDDLLLLDMASGDPSARDEDVDNALRAMPDHTLANRLLGTRLLEQGEPIRALAAFQRSVSTHPTVESLNNLAETLRRLKRLDEAEQAARAALAMNDKLYAVWDTLGCVLSDKGQLDDAAEAITKSLSLDDSDPDVHMNLVGIRSKQGRLDEVREILARPVLKGVKLRLDTVGVVP
jgi:tetratricopeptide (TPR) repeat protein